MHTLIQAVETGTILALTILLLKDVDIDGQSCIWVFRLLSFAAITIHMGCKSLSNTAFLIESVIRPPAVDNVYLTATLSM